MTRLLDRVITAHGGLDKFRKLSTLDLHILNNGVTWALKGVSGILSDFHCQIELHKQRVTFPGFKRPDQQAVFETSKITVENRDGQIVDELNHPMASIKGQTLQTPWSEPQLIYFAGYALWQYMTAPFIFSLPGFETEELGPWRENGETLDRLRVHFPDNLARHTKEQIYYFDSNGLLRRHDYVSEPIMPDSVAAHYILEHKEINGIILGTKRRVYSTNPDLSFNREPILVAIDVEEAEFK